MIGNSTTAQTDAGREVRMARQGISKEILLDVAEQLCAEVGSQAVRHAEIAKRVGIKPPSIYAHFDSLDDILSAVARRGLLAMLATYDGLPEATNPVDALNQVQNRQIDYLVAHPGFTRLALADLNLPGGTAAVASNLDLIDVIDARERQLFDRAIAMGLIPPADFSLWLGRRTGAVYVTLSLEWLNGRTITSGRLEQIKAYLALPSGT